ncbi:DUF4268 domain-containing protein [Marinigracilibium pacificum]|uniref:DUF4268 domain-containing protein n=1 Tax=Marinigracilibium pacificum TaxID=2729599 RepID=A0A848JAB1_9BACT|nr:DUF4268 domain-containing protein [Marinigracilibium pacificum]NMM49982.1 DUF4268 domain-containing protein [Marinigracilibium pacificum]
MYSKEAASAIRKEFWTKLGQFMKPVPSADGLKVNWINYKTGVKGIRFKLDAKDKLAWCGIAVEHKDADISSLLFDQLVELEKMLESESGEEWILNAPGEYRYGIPQPGYYQVLEGVKIMNENDWPEMISFFKKNLIILDEFWSTANYAFEIFKG